MTSNVSEAPLGRRLNVLERGFDHVRLARYVAKPSLAWGDLLGSWDDLPADPYVKPPNPGRFRRYARFSFTRERGTLIALPHAPFYQDIELNSYAGGIHREFAPIAPATIANPVLDATLHAGISAFIDEDDPRSWELGVHQIRVIAEGDHEGMPTPEGPHRDGFDFVAIHLVNRENVVGAESQLIVGEKESAFTLLEPLETVFVDDRRCLHAASSLRPADPSKRAARDTLIVTFHYLRR